LLGLGLLVVVALPARGDWLVLRDGSQVETKGAWTVEGKLVQFTLPTGALASLRLSEVDLEASDRRTAAAAKAAQRAARPAPTERKKAVFVLTDADVSHPPSPGDQPAAEGETAATVAGTAAPAAPGAVAVTAWEQLDAADGNGLEIRGTVRNQGTSPVAGLEIEAIVYDVDGKVLVTQSGQVSAGALAPGRPANFRVSLPGVFTFGAVQFRLDHETLSVGGQGEERQPGAEEEEEEVDSG
jgi:hypothetical protein